MPAILRLYHIYHIFPFSYFLDKTRVSLSTCPMKTLSNLTLELAGSRGRQADWEFGGVVLTGS